MFTRGTKVLIVLAVFAAQALGPAAAQDDRLTGKLVYEEGIQPDGQKSPAIVVRDMATLEHRIVAAPGMSPRWFPSAQEIAYFLPDNMQNGIVDVPDAPDVTERRILLGGTFYRYRAVFPGRTIVIDTVGNRRRELKHFVADIDSTGRLALTIRPVVGPAPTLRSRSGDLLVQDISTGELSMLLSAAQIAGDADKEALRDARWVPDGRSVVYQTETLTQDQRGYWIGSWALYLLEIATKNRSRLMLRSAVTAGTGPRDFSVSPDGKKIVFSVLGDNDLWVFDLAAARTEKLEVGQSGYRKREPRFSPDGRSVLFELIDQTDTYGTTSFWIAPSTGGSAKRLFPRSWRHIVRQFVLKEYDHLADWWQPPRSQ